MLPEDEAPVLPEVPELLEVSDDPLEPGVDVDPLPDPMPEEEPDVLPLVVEPLEVPVAPDEDGESDEGATLPDAEPVAEPIPEADPEAEPEALGPVVPHAARINAQAAGMMNRFMVSPS